MTAKRASKIKSPVPFDPPLTLDDLLRDPIAVIVRVRKEEPLLCGGGYQPYDPNRVPDWRERVQRDREWMTDEHSVEQLIRAARFIAAANRSVTLNREHATYRWKHRAEDFAAMTNDSTGKYVGEGMFIVAALALGLTVVPTGMNGHCYVNLSEAAWKMCASHREVS